jgi:purine-binding chemotaxis protein CheW
MAPENNQSKSDREINPGGESLKNEQLQDVNDALNIEAEEEGKAMLIVFPLGDEEFALTIDHVKEVVKIPPITPIPQVANYIKGVANVRGNVHMIIDLADKLGINNDSTPSYIMVIQDDEYHMAIAIDKVPDTIIVSNNDFDYSSDVMINSDHQETFIKSIVKTDDRMIIVLDVIEMIKTDEQAVQN